MKLAMEVAVAAIPTRAWNAATVYGSSVTATRFPIVDPMAAEVPSRAIACIKTGAGRLSYARAVVTPPATPVIPRAFPRRAVF